MGCDVSILSKHNLNISNVETLAIDLSNRLSLTIEHGYYAVKEYNELLENGLKEGFISLGLISNQSFVKKYKLIDERYQHKELYKKFGDALYSMKEYWHWYDSDGSNIEMPNQEKILQEKNDLQIADYLLETHSEYAEGGYMTIYNEIVMNDLHYYTRWWDFCNTIQTRNYFDDDYFQNFRKSVMKDTMLLGGEKAYYVNDQCNYLKGVGQGEEMYLTWKQLENHIASSLGLELISISKTVLDKQYQYEVKYKSERTLAFYDDFEDIRFIE